MGAAGKAKDAKARATIAARLLKTAKPWHRGGYGLGRSFDSCFEMGDGSEVKRLLIERASRDPSLIDAMRLHASQTGTWADEAAALARVGPCGTPLEPDLAPDCEACARGDPPGGNVDLACEDCGHRSCERGA